MRKKLTFTMAALALLTASAIAAPTAYLTGSGGAWPNAHYNVNLTGDLSEWAAYGITENFVTFCVQSKVTFDPGSKHVYYASIDDIIKINPGTGLTDDAMKLYAAYLNGTTNGYSANDFQVTIWAALGESKPSGAAGTSFLASFNDNDFDVAGWQNVKVLNLWKNEAMTQQVQSQMVMVTPIPAPGAILLTGLGTTLVGVLRRRRAL